MSRRPMPTPPRRRPVKPVIDAQADMDAKFEAKRQDRLALTRDRSSERLDLHWHVHECKKDGRPLMYEPFEDAICDIVEDMRMLSLSDSLIAKYLGNSMATIETWLLTHPKFLGAWLSGGELAEAELVRAMRHRALGYSHSAEKISFGKDGEVFRATYTEHYPPDKAAGEFLLTNTKGSRWKTKQTTELTGADGSALVPPAITLVGVVAGGNIPDETLLD